AIFGFGLFFHSDVSPQLIALNIFDPQSTYAFRHQPVAFLACHRQKVQNSPRVNTRHSGSAANRATLNQVLQDTHGLLFSQDHIGNGLWTRLSRSFFTERAAVSLLAISVFSELLSWLVAIWTIHFPLHFDNATISLCASIVKKNYGTNAPGINGTRIRYCFAPMYCAVC